MSHRACLPWTAMRVLPDAGNGRQANHRRWLDVTVARQVHLTVESVRQVGREPPIRISLRKSARLHPMLISEIVSRSTASRAKRRTRIRSQRNSRTAIAQEKRLFDAESCRHTASMPWPPDTGVITYRTVGLSVRGNRPAPHWKVLASSAVARRRGPAGNSIHLWTALRMRAVSSPWPNQPRSPLGSTAASPPGGAAEMGIGPVFAVPNF